jgi:hypothetical protein
LVLLVEKQHKGYGCKTHKTDSQNSDITAPNGRELYHLQFSLQAASLETFGYTLVLIHGIVFSYAVNTASQRDTLLITCRTVPFNSSEFFIQST